MKKIIRGLSLLAVLLCASHACADSYRIIETTFMNNFPVKVSSRAPQPLKDKKGVVFPDFSMTPYEKHLAFFSLFKDASSAATTSLEGIIDSKTIADLSFFFYSSQAPTQSLLERLYRGHSLNGKIALGSLCIQPTIDPESISQKQEITRHILSSPERCKRLMALFKQLESLEDSLYSLWNKHDALYSSYVEKTFYSGNFKKFSGAGGKHLLEFVRRGNDSKPLWGVALSSVLNGGFSWVAHSAIQGQAAPLSTLMPPEIQVLSAVAQRKNIDPLAGKLAAINLASSALVLPLSLPPLLGEIGGRMAFIRQIRTRFAVLSQFCDLIKEIHTELMHDPLLYHACDPKEAIGAFLEKKDPHHKALFKAFASNSFKKNTSYFFTHMGTVAQIIPLFLEAQKSFRPLFKALGRCEALISVARFYEEKTQSKNPWCFATFTQKERPFFSLVDYVHPFILDTQAVPNSLELGIKNYGMIVTGPNASGKSINIRALILCILLGQSLGISPAREATFTPMSKILSYLNPVDNLAEGKSLFRAEEERISSIIRQAHALAPDQFSLIVADELLSGTAPIEGEAATWGIAYGFAQLFNCMPIFATHFPKLTSLPAHTNGFYANYHVSVIQKPNNDFEHTFKLEPGRSHQVIALDLARKSGFDSDILDTADAFLSKKGFKRGRITQ